MQTSQTRTSVAGLSAGGRQLCDECLTAVVHLPVTQCETIARSCGRIYMAVVRLLRMTLIYRRAPRQEDTLETSVGGKEESE